MTAGGTAGYLRESVHELHLVRDTTRMLRDISAKLKKVRTNAALLEDEPARTTDRSALDAPGSR